MLTNEWPIFEKIHRKRLTMVVLKKENCVTREQEQEDNFSLHTHFC